MRIAAIPLMRQPDEVLQMVLFAAWTLQALRNIDAFTLLGSQVMREASECHVKREHVRPSEPPAPLRG